MGKNNLQDIEEVYFKNPAKKLSDNHSLKLIESEDELKC